MYPSAYFLKYGSSAPPAKRTKLNNSHIAAIFDKYKDNETGNIEIEGTIQYLEDLGYDAEDPVALVLAYFLESPSTGVFKKDSFINQWSHKNAETISEMKSVLSNFKIKLAHDDEFLKQVYDFTFGFIIEGSQKKISHEDAVLYWQLLLSDRFPREVKLWTEYIYEDWQKPISRDAWNMFFLFLKESFSTDPQLQNYDEAAAWPSIIDGFVEWLRENNMLN